MTEAPTLGKIYKKLEPEWFQYLLDRAMTYYVPTERVIYGPELMAPKEGRAYHTDLYLLDGAVVDYVAVSKQPSFCGTYKETSIVLAEVWCDRGSDGHVMWMPVGWRFVPHYCMHFASMYDEKLNLPEPMVLQFWEYR